MTFGLRLMSRDGVPIKVKEQAQMATEPDDFKDLHRSTERAGLAYTPSVLVYGIMVKSQLENREYLYCANAVATPWITNTEWSAQSRVRKLKKRIKNPIFVVKLRVGIVEVLDEHTQ